MGIDYQLLGGIHESTGIGGTAKIYKEPAIVAFVDGHSLLTYAINLAILPDKSVNLPSLLGRDILRHWTMLHSPKTGELHFEAQQRNPLARWLGRTWLGRH